MNSVLRILLLTVCIVSHPAFADTESPDWDALSEQQQQVLKPFKEQWPALDNERRQRLVGAAQSAFGRLDIVVNNAGWTHRKKPYVEVTEAEFDRVYAVNVKSVYLSAMEAVPVFRKQGGGCIVNIASTAGLRPRPELTVYNSSKGAVILMSKSMAGEFGPDNIRVNCVNPVFSPETALSAEFAGGAVTEEARKRFLATIPLGRFSTPLDVANACLYLASDEASLISGVCIEVDGARCV